MVIKQDDSYLSQLKIEGLDSSYHLTLNAGANKVIPLIISPNPVKHIHGEAFNGLIRVTYGSNTVESNQFSMSINQVLESVTVTNLASVVNDIHLTLIY
jgi:hypothetical protein